MKSISINIKPGGQKNAARSKKSEIFKVQIYLEIILQFSWITLSIYKL